MDHLGLINLDQLRESIRKDTIMVIVMWANNESGVIQDVRSIGEICSTLGIPFVCDATQAVGKIRVAPKDNGVDIMVVSAHKMYGPKGCGAIYISNDEKKLKPIALIHGGGHEMGYRAGTLNVPGIVGLGAASKLILEASLKDISEIEILRNKFENIIFSQVEEVEINGSLDRRLPTVSNLKALYVDSQAVMTKLRTKVSISSGSACSSADPSPSHVLLSMGLSAAEAKGSFRISLGRPTTGQEIEIAAGWLAEAINEYRSQSPVWQMFKQGINMPDITR